MASRQRGASQSQPAQMLFPATGQKRFVVSSVGRFVRLSFVPLRRTGGLDLADPQTGSGLGRFYACNSCAHPRPSLSAVRCNTRRLARLLQRRPRGGVRGRLTACGARKWSSQRLIRFCALGSFRGLKTTASGRLRTLRRTVIASLS
jgi:hypothetical protein